MHVYKQHSICECCLLDTNECKEHSSGCTQICNNTPGSYFCTCHAGYIVDSNNHTCNGECSIILAAFSLTTTSQSIIADINECATGNGGCEQNCNNTVGSYDCSCNVGFQLGNDYHACSGKKKHFLNKNSQIIISQMLMSVILIIVTVTRTVTIHMVPITAHATVDGIWILMDIAVMVMSELVVTHTICII